jgi:hypothetical protein
MELAVKLMILPVPYGLSDFGSSLNQCRQLFCKRILLKLPIPTIMLRFPSAGQHRHWGLWELPSGYTRGAYLFHLRIPGIRKKRIWKGLYLTRF